MRCPSALKRNEPSSHGKAWRNITCTLQSERSPSEEDRCCLTPIMTFNKGKTLERVKSTGCQGLGGREEGIGGARRSRGPRTTLCDAVMMETCRHTLIHAHSTYTNSNPNLNYGPRAIVVCQRRVVGCNRCSTLVGVLITGGCARVGAGGAWEIPVPSFPYCCEPKTALKKKVFKKMSSSSNTELSYNAEKIFPTYNPAEKKKGDTCG